MSNNYEVEEGIVWLLGVKIYLTVDKKVPKRRLGMLGNLYSGTFKRFATVLPGVSQMSP